MTSPDSTASPDGPASSDGSGSSGDPGSPASPAPVGGAGVIETTGIEIIAESERTAKPRDLVWPWFAANVSVFGMSYGSY
ncbi:MAG: hypothetical protein ACTHUS_07610, partial [Brachybacterium tyrofermentans]